MAKIKTQVQLQAFANLHGLRDDWHEPDEQEVSARVTGVVFDNAGLRSELVVTLYTENGFYDVNLANLFAWAARLND